MKSKLATISFLVMAALTCPYPMVKAQTCSSTVGANTANSFTTAANTGATFSWANAANAQTSDGSYATAGITLGILSSAYSNYIVIKDFGFSIPSTAIICKIIVEVQRSASGLAVGGSVTDKSVMLLQNGALTGNDLASGSAWPGADAIATYGNTALASAWGGSWQPSDVNSPNFGVAIATQVNTGLASLTLTGKINQVRVTIVYDPNTLLAITLGKFTATEAPGQDGHLLNWTADADAGGNFIVQRSSNGQDWTNIATVPVSSTFSRTNQLGTSAFLAYSYTDHTPLDGANFYRLHMISADGKSAWSTVSEVVKNSILTARAWPNPCAHTITVSSPQPVSRIILKDLDGRTLYMRQAATPSNNWQVPMDHLPPGIYLIQVGTQILRVMKQDMN